MPFFTHIIISFALLSISLFIQTEIKAQEPAEIISNPRKCWEIKLENINEYSFASDNESVFILLNSKGSVNNFEIKSGLNLWKTETGVENVEKIFFEKKVIHLNGSKNLSLSAETGLISNNSLKDYKQFNYGDKPLNLSDVTTNLQITYLPSGAVVKSDDKGNFSFSRNQKVSWKSKVGGKVTGITDAGENLVIASLDNFIYLFSKKNGAKIWKKRLSGRVISAPIVTENEVVSAIAGSNTAFVLQLRDGNEIYRISLEEPFFFIKPLLKVKGIYIFQTTYGLAGFSKEFCGS